MLKTENGDVQANQIRESLVISVILPTQNEGMPVYQSAKSLEQIIPNDISYEIIVVHYNREDAMNNRVSLNEGDDMSVENKKIMDLDRVPKYNQILHAHIRGQFAEAVMTGIEMSSGQFILAIDANFPYPQEVITDLAREIINSPNSIIIASRYAKGSSIQPLPFVHNTISKGARIIVEHGLKVKDVKDPLSSCFGFSRHHIKGINIEGKGNEILLEILVKVNSKKENKIVSIKEIPFTQKAVPSTKKLDFNRIMSYSKAVWHLYLFGRKSKQIQSDVDIEQQEKHKSVLFLSKAGRFFTVGASGLVVNYVVSLLLSNMIPNIWYIHATFVGIIVSISSNFVLNKVWTFEDWDFSIKHFLRQYGLFLLLCSFGAGIQLFLVSLFVDYYHLQYSVSLIMAVCIASIGNFLLNKKITFGEKIWE